MPQPPTWLQDLAAIGEAAGGLALLLAILIFIRDRGAADRTQVDQLAVWWEGEPESARELTSGEPLWVNVRVFLKNASNLPMEIAHAGIDVGSTWLVPDHDQPDKRPLVFTPTQATKKSSFFFYGLRLAPDLTHVQPHRLDLSENAPAYSTELSPLQGVTCEFRSILVTDNAGRRWRIRPGRGGPAKRLRWYSRRRDEYEPRRRSLGSYIVAPFIPPEPWR